MPSSLADRAGSAGEQRAAGGRPRIAQRADRAGGLLHRHIHFGVAVPADPDDAIADHCVVERRLESLGCWRFDRRAELFERGLGSPASQFGHHGFIARPGLAEDTDAGPLDSGRVASRSATCRPCM